jgi:hypothetical protein
MAQETINVGTTPNDGLGDPLRTAFTKTNNNFNQLFATAGITGIANGTSNVNIPQANGNVTISSAGSANVITVTGTGVNVAGTLNSSGLATLSNLSVTGATISTGTIQSLADVTAVTITASGNLSANNAVITGNVTGALFTGNGAGLTGVIATGNVGAASQLTNGTTTMNIPVANGNMIGNVGGVLNIFTLSTGGLEIAGIVSASGNITGGNLQTTGSISSTGNVTGNYILGNGSQLTGVDATQIINGTSNAKVVSSGGNIAVGIGGTSNVTVFATTGAFITGETSASGNVTGGNLLTGGLISATGNILTGGLVSAVANVTANNGMFTTIVNVASHTGDVVSVTGNVTANNGMFTTIVNVASHTGAVVSVSGNITGGNLLFGSGIASGTGNITGGNVLTGGLISATGNVLGNVFTVNLGNTTTAIINGGSNAVGNIGSSSNYFNQVFAQATTALYADLAEIYSADAEYPPGTVVSFGGDQEITKSTLAGDPRVAGVISDRPSYLMNAALQAQHRAAVALTGRVPTRVIGPVAKGDMMVSAGNGKAQASAAPAMGTVIGKALENFSNDSGTIEIVVGRM